MSVKQKQQKEIIGHKLSPWHFLSFFSTPVNKKTQHPSMEKSQKMLERQSARLVGLINISGEEFVYIKQSEKESTQKKIVHH